ncbi:unnamed protein product [Didymodactylos carnosus]|uniref:LIM zinc-binding domain-containing protein n=1 Tax=Didymodactylos carnosus TaxID=1234261 RepID=A0A8S2FDQ1_9BILA|nr:unnamed protein product [Didymodactylos carnosus]CAF4232143.1 unnamed protein product [Didymodactylos carnosus]
MCAGCGCQIFDQFILKVAPNMEWHADCLKCSECGQYLDENTTCFVRDGKTYCKLDYSRAEILKLFTSKCSRCHQYFTKNDFVMRAKYKIYHTECFRCDICDKLLLPGDEYSLKENEIYCRQDHDQLEETNKYQLENNSKSPTTLTNDCIESKNGKFRGEEEKKNAFFVFYYTKKKRCMRIAATTGTTIPVMTEV